MACNQYDYAAQLAEQFPNLDETTRGQLGEWAGALAVQARVDEIIRFAQAGHDQQMHSVEQVQSYFMARVVMLAMGQGDEGSIPQGPVELA